MYQFLKNVITSIIPKQIIRKYKPIFRNIVYLFYKGNNYTCNICNAKLKTFIKLPNSDLLCPSCGSLPRTRRLYHILTEEELLNGAILHFSPPFSLYNILKQNPTIQYVSSDYEDEFLADVKYDITNIPVKKETFDLFIAYHVLEHIEADSTAMKELFRITKKGGFGLIQTPFKEGDIYEDYTIQTPADRLKYFGQQDHVRIYGVDGLKKRLQKVGFKVEVLIFSEKVDNFHEFKEVETVLIVSK